MPLLKQRRSQQLVKDAVVLDLGDIDRQARELLNQARADAAAILHEAKSEADKLIAEAEGVGRSRGMEQGIADGLAQGREQGRQEIIAELKPQLEQMLESWSAALTQWENDRAEMLQQARGDVLSVALEMGRRITLKTIECDPAIVQSQLAEALAMVCRRTAVAIAINPADRPLIEEVLPELLAKSRTCTDASIRDDPDMQRGGCKVITENGEIDASIQTQLDRIVSALIPGQSAVGGGGAA